MKKYIKYIVLFVLVILIIIFLFKKYSLSFGFKPQLKYSELEDYLLENNDALIYVTNDKKISNIKKYFENKDIKIIYMYLNGDEVLKFSNKYGITNLPKLVYFKDGNLGEYIVFDKETIEDFLRRNGFLE